MAGALVAEALAQGDMGLAVAALAPGAVATAIGLWGTEAQQQTYLPAFTGDGWEGVPAAALTLAEPTRALRPVRRPRPPPLRDGDGFVLDGVKSAVVRGADAELFVVGGRCSTARRPCSSSSPAPTGSRSRPTPRWACAPRR